MWTLTVELSFYLIVPIITGLVKRSFRVGISTLLGVMLASLYLASHFSVAFIAKHPLLDLICFAYLWIFGIGMMLRLLWPYVSHFFCRKAWLWLPIYVAAGLYGARLGWFPLGLDFHTGVNPITALRVTFLGFTIISCAYTLSSASKWLKGVDISYGLYLWHMLFVTLCLAFGITGHWWLWLLIPACTATVAYISYRFIERPALKLKATTPNFGIWRQHISVIGQSSR